LIAVGFIAVWVALIGFALAEAVRHHRYAWLVIVPAGLWALRALISGLKKVRRYGAGRLHGRHVG
jgi:hypothetical protein